MSSESACGLGMRSGHARFSQRHGGGGGGGAIGGGGGGGAAASAASLSKSAAVLREGLSGAPRAVEIYLSLGSLLEPSEATRRRVRDL